VANCELAPTDARPSAAAASLPRTPSQHAVTESEILSILIVCCPLALGTVGLGRQ